MSVDPSGAEIIWLRADYNLALSRNESMVQFLIHSPARAQVQIQSLKRGRLCSRANIGRPESTHIRSGERKIAVAAMESATVSINKTDECKNFSPAYRKLDEPWTPS